MRTGSSNPPASNESVLTAGPVSNCSGFSGDKLSLVERTGGVPLFVEELTPPR
jgi:hypothetical protein